MIKPPFLRIPRIDLLHIHAREKADEMHADLESVGKLLPFPIVDIETPGSAATGFWDFHSDLDTNFATGTKEAWLAARAAWQANPDQSRLAMYRLMELTKKWGVKFQFTIQSPAVKNDPFKACWSWRERVMYHPDAVMKKEKYFFTSEDEDGNLHYLGDPYPDAEVEQWAAIYGDNFKRIGFTKDSEWIRTSLNSDLRPS